MGKTDAEHFLARISGKQKLILHLAEGTQESARQHFLALQVKPDRWAITENLIGIHCVGLTADDFAVFGSWDALIALAREVQRLFHRFTEENLKEYPGAEGKTISMAIALAPETYFPLSTVYEEAGR